MRKTRRWSVLTVIALVVVLCPALLAFNASIHEKLHALTGQPDSSCALCTFAYGQVANAQPAVLPPELADCELVYKPVLCGLILERVAFFLPPDRAPPAA